MSTTASLHEGYVIHQRPYRETSALLEAFTRDAGRVGLVARGVRRAQRKGGSVPGLFCCHLFSWSGQGDLYSLRSAEPTGMSVTIKGERLYAGLYANELLMRLCTRHDPHPELYDAYQALLTALSGTSPAVMETDIALRYFERDLLQETGYGLNLTFEAVSGAVIEPALRYAYRAQQGPVLAGADRADTHGVQGDTLLALAEGCLHGERQRREARDLMRRIIRDVAGDKPLQSLEILRRIRQMTRTSVNKGSGQ